MWIVYQVAMAAALLAAAPILLARRGRHYWPTLRQRLGGYGALAPPAPEALWIHAVSVGEVAVAEALVRALPASRPLLITTVTATGHRRACAAFAARSATIAYLPFDLGLPIRRFVQRFRPAALILVEGDYWPLILRTCHQRGMPVAVVNGRFGARSFGRWRKLAKLWLAKLWLAKLWPAIHRPVVCFGMQTAEDRARLLALGAEPQRVTVTGNLKFEMPEPAPQPALEAALLRMAGERPILVAGSTMQGEDALVLDAFVAAGGGARALLVLVPRHPERWDQAEALAVERGLHLLRRSRLATLASDGPIKAPAVLLLDSMGELAALYRLASAAFIGGTLVPTGGHNPLEAARFGVPVVVGPSMVNFRQIAEQFEAAQAWRRVDSGPALAAAWCALLDAPAEAAALGARGRALVRANRGALERTRALLAPLLDTSPATSHSERSAGDAA